MSDIYLIVGLGNPGSEYDRTKHNVGFSAIDKICEKLNLKLDKEKFNGAYTKTNINNKEVIIAKPLTYMNLSGNFVKDIVNFYKIKVQNIIVLYDDIDTKIGSLRVRSKGSSGGQNGIKNIIQLLGTELIKRVRIGIGKPDKQNLADYVLSSFKIEDLVNIQLAINNAANAAIDFVKIDDFEKVISKYNN